MCTQKTEEKSQFYVLQANVKVIYLNLIILKVCVKRQLFLVQKFNQV